MQVLLPSCQKYKQTDKPLYNVITDHVWQVKGDNYYYHFLPDSIWHYNLDIDNDTSSYIPVGRKWWLDETENAFYIKITNISLEGELIEDQYNITKYIISKYNDYRIYTNYQHVLKSGEEECCPLSEEEREVVFYAQ